MIPVSRSLSEATTQSKRMGICGCARDQRCEKTNHECPDVNQQARDTLPPTLRSRSPPDPLCLQPIITQHSIRDGIPRRLVRVVIKGRQVILHMHIRRQRFQPLGNCLQPPEDSQHPRLMQKYRRGTQAECRHPFAAGVLAKDAYHCQCFLVR